MTSRQEAYELIDSLPEDSVRAVIEIMIRMIPENKNKKQETASRKMKAFLALQELRKSARRYDFSEENRAAETDRKFGVL